MGIADYSTADLLLAEREDIGVGAPRLVRRRAFSKVPRRCPRCLNVLEKVGSLGGWLVPQNYYCPRCGYEGFAFLESAADRETEG
jgi:ribosomal protein S27AE